MSRDYRDFGLMFNFDKFYSIIVWNTDKILSVAKRFLNYYLILPVKGLSFLSLKLDELLKIKRIKGSKKLNLKYV
jgi:hypothetical protein